MKYQFTTNPYGQKGINDFFGVEILDNSIEALREIAWTGWTPEEIQMIINKSIALQGDEEYEYQVVGSDLIINIDKNEVHFFDWHTEQEKADFVWTFDEFIAFMKAFKEFVKENQ